MQELPSDALTNMTLAMNRNARYYLDSGLPPNVSEAESLDSEGILGLRDIVDTAETGERAVSGQGMEGATQDVGCVEGQREGGAERDQPVSAENASAASAEAARLVVSQGKRAGPVVAAAGGAPQGQKPKRVKEKIGRFDAVCVGARFYLGESWQADLVAGMPLKLVRDKNNTHDANAICVQLPGRGGVEGLQDGKANECKVADLAQDASTLGYLPKGPRFHMSV